MHRPQQNVLKKSHDIPRFTMTQKNVYHFQLLTFINSIICYLESLDTNNN